MVRRNALWWLVSELALLIAAAGAVVWWRCLSPAATAPPPHERDVYNSPAGMSDIGVPLEADLSALAAMLDREIPRDLWTIDQRDVACAAPQRIRLFGAQVPITPKVTCTLSGTVTIAHDWTNPPTIAILGLHIPFTDRAEAKLAPIVARLQRTLPAELERWNLRDQIASIWRQGFGVWSLNDHDPPVWLTDEARLRYAPDRPGP